MSPETVNIVSLAQRNVMLSALHRPPSAKSSCYDVDIAVRPAPDEADERNSLKHRAALLFIFWENIEAEISTPIYSVY